MKYTLSSLIVLLLLFTPLIVLGQNLSQSAPILPESLAARSEMAASIKTITVFIAAEESDKPEEAVTLLNASNDEYAKKGWKVFSILNYELDGDFEGFFVTYQRNLVIE